MHKEYEALRLRNQLDPKRFYRKDPDEERGVKGLPKHFAVRIFENHGSRYSENLPIRLAQSLRQEHGFGGPSSVSLPRSARKRTLVDELVDDAEARHHELTRCEGSQYSGRSAVHCTKTEVVVPNQLMIRLYHMTVTRQEC